MKNYQGGAGFKRDTLSELYLTGVSTLAGEDNFYETGAVRLAAFADLVYQATATDHEWVAGFLVWLRRDAGLRTIAIVGAAEYAHACVKLGIPGSRQVVNDVCVRSDEPGELLAYWHSRYGRNLPKPVKRGIADAAARTYNEYTYGGWDSDSKAYRFADVISLTHPKPRDDNQAVLFRLALAERRGLPEIDILPGQLPMTAARKDLLSLPVHARRDIMLLDPTQLKAAGMTWQTVSGWIQRPMDQLVWEAVIPQMGYYDLIRNLRNFDKNGVSDSVAMQVISKIAHPDQVAKSRVMPMQLLNAYRYAPSLRWAYGLEVALTHSLSNIPALPGKTLILVDTSSSMNAAFSKDGSLMRWDAAALFGIALGQRCEKSEIVSYSSAQRYWGDPAGTKTKLFPKVEGESILKSVERWKSGGYFLGGGTDTLGAVKQHFASYHDRVVILTDEQAQTQDPGAYLPTSVPLYVWNLAGYQYGNSASGGQSGRHVFGGLTDKSFRMIPLLESGKHGSWPWVKASSS